MFALRRTAARAIASAPSRAVFAQPRSIITITPKAFQTKQQQKIAPLLQRRWVSDSQNFSQTAPEAPVDEELSPVTEATQAEPTDATQAEPTEATQAEPTDASATASADSLEAAVEKPATGKLWNRAAPGEPHNTIYVGNLYYEVTPDQMKRVFSRFGAIKKTSVIYDNRGMSRGFGYVEFENVEDAQSAIDNLDMQVFEGRNLVVQFHQPKYNAKANRAEVVPNPPSKTLFIGNMSYEMSDKDLNDVFRDIRNVMDVRVAIDRRTGQPRGFAHADFIDVASATRAREVLKEKVIYGRQLRVDYTTSGTSKQRDTPPSA